LIDAVQLPPKKRCNSNYYFARHDINFQGMDPYLLRKSWNVSIKAKLKTTIIYQLTNGNRIIYLIKVFA
jgi:hypothetical protein